MSDAERYIVVPQSGFMPDPRKVRSVHRTCRAAERFVREQGARSFILTIYRVAEPVRKGAPWYRSDDDRHAGARC